MTLMAPVRRRKRDEGLGADWEQSFIAAPSGLPTRPVSDQPLGK